MYIIMPNSSFSAFGTVSSSIIPIQKKYTGIEQRFRAYIYKGGDVMIHEFYDPANLQRLKVAAPFLCGQLEKNLIQIHKTWQLLISNPAPLNEDRVLYFLDLIDLLDNFT